MSSSVTHPTQTTHQGSMVISQGSAGSKSRTFFLRNSLRLDRHWFMRSMYWFLPIPNNLRPVDLSMGVTDMGYKYEEKKQYMIQIAFSYK